MGTVIRDADRLFARPIVEMEECADGVRIMRAGIPLPDSYARCVGEWLEHWAATEPDRVFLAERDTRGEWVRLTYGEARRRVVSIATWMLGQDLSPERPVVILSDNSIEHALMMLAAMHIGVPSCAISSGNSLISKDFAKLKHAIELLRPGVIYADTVERFVPALKAVSGLHDGVVVAGGRSADHDFKPFSEVEVAPDEAAVMQAFARITPDTIAKFLFTSGSAGAPKAVINTHRMLCSNQLVREIIWPFLAENRPVMLEWLPWSHTFGGNHNFNMNLRWGGTMHLDEGKPTSALIGTTVRNIKEISPTVYFSVPRAYDMLVPLLREDAELRESFFRRLNVILYAGAALPQHLWSALEDLSEQTVGEKIIMVSSWGATETAPTCTDCHYPAATTGVIGVPVPGVELKLLPVGGKLEVRARGPNVFPGYWKQPELSAKAFDDEGFYMIGDAVRFVDEACPEEGLLFDGRVGEDFKLLTGTWVHVGSLRVNGIDALKPVAQDIVVTGHDRDDIGFLIFPNLPQCRALCPDLPADAPVADVLAHPAVVARVRDGLATMKRIGGGSSTYAARAMLVGEPPSVEAGEITDKGYINQRAVLTRRAELVECLYSDAADGRIITPAPATPR